MARLVSACAQPHPGNDTTLPPAGIVQGKATVRAVDRKTDFACFDIELPAERADNVVIGEEKGGG